MDRSNIDMDESLEVINIDCPEKYLPLEGGRDVGTDNSRGSLLLVYFFIFAITGKATKY